MGSFLAVKRVRVAQGNVAVYDESFHHGVNIIRGDNSSGKSTIADFVFFGLGGEFDRWKDAAVQCSGVRLEVETTEAVLTLHRSVGAKQEPILVYYGGLEESLTAGIDNWIRLPIRRAASGKDLSLTQVLFRAIGIPEAPSLGNSNITMHQVMRLLYADQQTPAGKLFRFESFDTRDIREAVGQLLIGVNGYELYEGQIRLRELKSDYTEKDREYRAALSALPTSEGLSSVATLNARTTELIAERETIIGQIRDVDTLVGAEQTTDFASERRAMQARIRNIGNKLNRMEQHAVVLTDEISEINQFLEHLVDQLATLTAADDLAERLGNIEFRYCPACLKPLDDSDGRHCIVCHEVIDDDSARSRYFEIRIDNELQIRESQQLLNAKRGELLDMQGETRALRREYSAEVAQFSARYDVSNSPRESFLAERNKRLGRIERELAYLDELRAAVERIDELSKQRGALNEEISKLEARLKRLSAAATSRLSRAMEIVGRIGCRLLKEDLSREDTFEDPRSFSLNFGDDAMLVGGKMNFAESSNVILKNTALFSLFLGACYDPEFWHPRFLLMDNIEDKGMEVERSHNFQRIIIEESQKVKIPHQIIFTTSMLDPKLEGGALTVGPKYTRQNKTLASIRTID